MRRSRSDDDIAFIARVEARELKVKRAPNPEVHFWGHPECISTWESERQNLPPRVRDGESYAHIFIETTIANRIVASDEQLEDLRADILNDLRGRQCDKANPPSTEPKRSDQ
jgi:hypothetical protein